MKIFEKDGQLWITSLELTDEINRLYRQYNITNNRGQIIEVKHKTIIRACTRELKSLEKWTSAPDGANPINVKSSIMKSEYTDENNRTYDMYNLNRDAALSVLMKYNDIVRYHVASEYNAMQRYLEETKQQELYSKWRVDDREKQKQAHKTIKDAIPNADKTDYIKMNMYVGKATNEVLGSKGFTNKKDMTPEQLYTRQAIQDDYTKIISAGADHQMAKTVINNNVIKGKYN